MLMREIDNQNIHCLVTGANGFVGRVLCDTLMQRGHKVRGAVRYSDESRNSKVPYVAVGEINSQTDWTEVVANIDVVIHLAARVHVMHETSKDPLGDFRNMNVSATEQLARAAAGNGVKRLVYVSSIKVNGEKTQYEQSFNEFDAPSPRGHYAVSKWEAEQALLRVASETGLEIVIVRPSLIYGRGVKGNFAQMLKILAMGIPVPLASARNLRSLVYIGNFVDALLLCATHPAAAGQVYLVSDGEDVSTPDLLRQLGTAMGHPARLLPCPLSFLKFAGKLFGKSDQIDRLLDSLQVNSGKIRRDLSWQPPYTLQQGLKETAEWFRNTNAG